MNRQRILATAGTVLGAFATGWAWFAVSGGIHEDFWITLALFATCLFNATSGPRRSPLTGRQRWIIGSLSALAIAVAAFDIAILLARVADRGQDDSHVARYLSARSWQWVVGYALVVVGGALSIAGVTKSGGPSPSRQDKTAESRDETLPR